MTNNNKDILGSFFLYNLPGFIGCMHFVLGYVQTMSILIDSRHSSKEISIMTKGYRAKSTDHELGGVKIS